MLNKLIKKLIILSCISLLSMNIFASEFSLPKQDSREKLKKRMPYMDYMEIESRISLGITGEYEYLDQDNDSESNLELISETLYQVDKHTKVGLGASAQFRGKMKTSTDKKFIYDSIPVYITYRYFPGKFKKKKPYIKLNYGISFNHGQENTEGQYYGVGIGIEDDDTWVYDILYESSEGKYLGEDCKQTMISLGIGYKIKF